MKKVVVTGPTGVVGMALISKLMDEGIYVVAVCHRNSSRIRNIPHSELVEIIECNLEDIDRLPELIKNTGDFECFFHLAWACTFGDSRNNIDAQIENIRYTINAVEVAARLGCRRFIGAGSQAEYGRCSDVLRPETPTFPENGYGIAKLCAGQLSRIRCEQLGIEHIWTRILSVYGPYDGENTLISSLIRKLKNGEHVSCTAAEQIWDYIYSEDVAEALYRIMDRGVSNKIYLIASGESHPLKYYIEIAKNCINPNVEIGYGEIPYSSLQVMNLRADISELVNDTGIVLNMNFKRGIKNIIEFV